MMNGFIDVAIGQDLTANILKSLKELENKKVCIGIPEEDNTLRGKIKNAELLYIHTHGIRETDMIREMQHDINDGVPYSKAHELYVHENGSPLWQSPPRPVLEPAIENSKELIAEKMKDVIEMALEGENIDAGLGAVGTLGQEVAKKWFTNPSNKWAKNSPETIRRKGSNRPLVNTGNLRKAIIYVIKDGNSDD